MLSSRFVALFFQVSRKAYIHVHCINAFFSVSNTNHITLGVTKNVIHTFKKKNIQMSSENPYSAQTHLLCCLANLFASQSHFSDAWHRPLELVHLCLLYTWYSFIKASRTNLMVKGYRKRIGSVCSFFKNKCRKGITFEIRNRK